MTRLLTIGIPTFNRSKSLALMLRSLSEDIKSFERGIEIIVSDNCSTDETFEVVRNWGGVQNAELRFRYIRQKENIGASKNLISLLYAATSAYFIFLGDDDKLNPVNFAYIMGVLAAGRSSAVIQGCWPGRRVHTSVGAVGFNQALTFFYEYGNAYGGIIDRAAAVRAIDSRMIREEIEKIVWPQTVFGFLAMFDLASVRSIEVVNCEIGGPLAESLNIPSKEYWIRSCSDLLRAAVLVQRHTGSLNLRKSLLSVGGGGFGLHIKAILLSAIVEGNRSSVEEVRLLLKNEFGWRGWLWSIFLKLDKHPFFLRILLGFAYRLKNMRRASSFDLRIAEARRQREVAISQSRQSGKRFGDWF